MNVRGKTVVLRALEREDLPLLRSWSNDPETQQNLAGWHFPTSSEAMERWFDRARQSEDRDLRLGIVAEPHGLVGTIGLTRIDWKDRNAFFGVAIGRTDLRRKAYGTDAVMAILCYAFDELGLERLDSTIVEYNEASHRLLVGKCGWREEGRKQNAIWRKGRFWQSIVIGITREDYRRLVERTRYWDA